jgi:hypothetical protein
MELENPEIENASVSGSEEIPDTVSDPEFLWYDFLTKNPPWRKIVVSDFEGMQKREIGSKGYIFTKKLPAPSLLMPCNHIKCRADHYYDLKIVAPNEAQENSDFYGLLVYQCRHCQETS